MLLLLLVCSMVPPPWHLQAPTGRVHYVADEAALRVLAEQKSLVKNGENLLRRLVDPGNTKVRLSFVSIHHARTRVAAGTHTHTHARTPCSELT